MHVRRTWPPMFLAAAVAAATAVSCDDSSGPPVNDVTPAIVPGGGVGSGAILRELNVFVIDDDTEAPITGANVRVGEPAAAGPLTGATDGAGLVTFTDASLVGAQTITVTAAGHVPSTWFGANGANVTIPLSATPQPAVPTAEVSGTIEGWDALPAPAAGHYRLALVAYSLTEKLGGPENEIEQPPGVGGIPRNGCLYAPPAVTGPCNWRLTTRIGPQAHIAAIIDGDSRGTPTPGDDVMTVTGYAVGTGLSFTEGQTVTGEVLTPLDSGALASFTVAFPDPPSGLELAGWLPLLDSGADGLLPMIHTLLMRDLTTTSVPALTGAFASGAYDLRAMAQVSESQERPFAGVFARDIDISTTVQAPEWLSPPADAAASGGTYSFTAAAGASLHVASFENADGDEVWGVALLDGRTSFSLPALSPDPLPAGQVTFVVTAIVAPSFSPTDFSVDSTEDSITRISENAVEFSH